jgi:predicted RNA binding protein YcfA (HicA-like mRNA interferase family)
MTKDELIAAISSAPGHFPVTSYDTQHDLVRAEVSEYDDDSGTHPCVILEFDGDDACWARECGARRCRRGSNAGASAGTFAEPPWDRRSGTDAIVWCAWEPVCIRGSHQVMRRKGREVSVLVHGNRSLPAGTLASICRQADCSAADLRALL